jgi:uncharacterized membrane protein
MLSIKFLSKAHKNLLLAIVVCFLIICTRAAISNSITFSFLIWNIFLAVLPICFSLFLLNVKGWLGKVILFTISIAFLPNSIYLVTDLQHLKERLPIPLYLDLIILLLAAWIGILSAVLSLKNIEQFLAKQLSSKYVMPSIWLIMLSCGFGVYLGRFLRWNSWDIISNPSLLCHDIVHRLFFPFQHLRTWSTTILIAIVYFLFYKTLYNINDKTNN